MAHPLPRLSLRSFARAAFVLMCLFVTTHAAKAEDSVSIEAATGNKTKVIRVGVQWAWDSQWDILENARLSGYWDLSMAYWHGSRHKDDASSHQNLAAIGITPVFRLAPKADYGVYAELGIGGPHLLSDLYDNNRRQLSTYLQFGSHLGLGYVFPNKLDATIRYQHYSNASIRKPNDGVNLLILRLSYPL